MEEVHVSNFVQEYYPIFTRVSPLVQEMLCGKVEIPITPYLDFLHWNCILVQPSVLVLIPFILIFSMDKYLYVWKPLNICYYLEEAPFSF